MENVPERVKYKCKNCRYEFTRNSRVPITHCPYCSKTGTLEMLKGDFASKILDDVDGSEED